MKQKLILILLISFTLISVIECQTRCYICNTAGGLHSDKCGDEFRLTSIDGTTCYGTCVKARGRRDEGGRSVVEIDRGCVIHQVEEGCGKEDYNGMSGADVCYCNENLCNHANNINTSCLSWILTSLLCLLMTFWRGQL